MYRGNKFESTRAKINTQLSMVFYKEETKKNDPKFGSLVMILRGFGFWRRYLETGLLDRQRTLNLVID